MNFLRNNLANAFTLANLFSGAVGIIHLIHNDISTALICIIISLVLDFFDGFVARALKSNSNLGIQLDSLADLVSFGFLPTLAMYKLLEPFGREWMNVTLPFELKYLGLFILLGSCLRLAIFNLDKEQKYYFKGLNTPTNTILIFGFLYSQYVDPTFFTFLHYPTALIIITIISTYLLVSPIKMISLKFKSAKLKDNLDKLTLVFGILVLLVIFGWHALPLSVVFYIMVSILFEKHLTN